MKLKTRKVNECNTCYMFKDCCISHAYEWNCVIYDCPCKVCLIKVVCQKICNDHGAYINNFFDYLKHNPVEYAKLLSNYKEPEPYLKHTNFYMLEVMRDTHVYIKYNYKENKYTMEAKHLL